MRIFVTGGTGFIGTHLVRRLKETPHELRCLARETSRTEALEAAGAVVVRGDVADKDSLVDGMRGCDWVANLANFYDFWAADRRVYRDVNISGTRNVMEAAITSGVSKVVHVSTAAVYGDAAWPVTEASEMGAHCFGEYTRTKREGDRLAWALHEEQQLPLVAIYPGGVFGPHDTKATARYIENMARGRMPAQVFPGTPFPWVHVRDVAEAIVRALEKDGNIGERYLVVSECPTFRALNTMIEELSGTRAPRIALPGWLTILGAHLATALANLTHRPPILDMAVEQMRLMQHGMQVDGSKCARELGISYMPIRQIIKEQVGLIAAGD